MNVPALLKIASTFAETNRTSKDFDALADVLEDYLPEAAQEARILAQLDKERAQLFVEVSKLLSDAEREHALLAAFSLEKFETQQLKLTVLLQEAKK